MYVALGRACFSDNKHAYMYMIFCLIGEEDRKLYEEAMTKGYIETSLALLILVGVTGSGKTLFKHLVLGEPVPKFSPSTALAEPTVRTMSVCKVAVGGGAAADGEGETGGEAAVGGDTWEIVLPEQIMNIIAGEMKRIQQKESKSNSSPQSDEGKKEDSGVGDVQPQPQDSVNHDTTPSPSAPAEPQDNDTMHTSSEARTLFHDALKEIKIEEELFKETTKSRKLMDVDFIYLVDSGGQPPFREMLPHFVQKASAIVLMQKLNERLDFKPTIRYREEGGKVDKGYTSQLTNEQILHQYIQGVQSHKSRVFVVGTHRDLESECEGETRAMKNKKLLDAFRPVLGKQMELYKQGNPDQPLFPVNCTSRGPEDQKTAGEFRKRVVKDNCMRQKVKIPLSWFLLEQVLQLLAEKMKVDVLSIEECREAAKEKLHLMDRSFEAALRYLGEFNIIFYRPTILEGVVFTNAQVVLDMITELVRCSHALRVGNDEASSDVVPSCMMGGEGLEFRDFGQVSHDLLQIAFNSHYREGVFSAADFLTLLQGLLIAGKLKNGKHFIASLLPDLPLEEVSEHRVTSPDHPAPLVFHYPDMWLPVGLMSSLVVYLNNKCKWKLSKMQGKPTCMYHNCIRFKMPEGRPGSVVIIDSTMFLEIHVVITVKSTHHKLCPMIKDSIIAGLKEAHKSLHYDPPLEPKIGFLCSGECGNREETHFATVDKYQESWRCSEDDCTGDTLNSRQSIWFGKTNEG